MKKWQFMNSDIKCIRSDTCDCICNKCFLQCYIDVKFYNWKSYENYVDWLDDLEEG